LSRRKSGDDSNTTGLSFIKIGKTIPKTNESQQNNSEGMDKRSFLYFV
jgi:hypothetical protein